MDLQKLVNAMNDMSRRDRSRYHLTLGKLIKSLGAADAGMPVAFRDGGSPTEPHSYRGYYSDMAIENTAEPISAGNFLLVCQAALGQTFEGYKGGDYVMGEDTPLWMAAYGCCGEAITDVEIKDGAIVLHTRDLDAS